MLVHENAEHFPFLRQITLSDLRKGFFNSSFCVLDDFFQHFLRVILILSNIFHDFLLSYGWTSFFILGPGPDAAAHVAKLRQQNVPVTVGRPSGWPKMGKHQV